MKEWMYIFDQILDFVYSLYNGRAKLKNVVKKTVCQENVPDIEERRAELPEGFWATCIVRQLFVICEKLHIFLLKFAK